MRSFARHHLSPLAVVVLFLASNLLAREPDASPQGAKLAAALQPFVDRQAVNGVVVLVADKDRVLDVASVGYADVAAGRAMQNDCLFWIASQSKPITAVGLMILADEGKLSIDDPVEKYLPEFKGQHVKVEVNKGETVLRSPSHPITIRNVLTHTSGLPFKTALETPTLDLFPLAERVRSYAATPLDFEPDTKFQYSNAGINTAGRIIEVLAKMPYEKFLEERIFRPLGMKDTSFVPTAEQLKRIAKAYDVDKTGLREVPIGQLKYPLDDPQRQPMPAGGLFSTAADMARFYRMVANHGQLEGTRILSEQTLALMTKKQTGNLVKQENGLGFAVGGGKIGHGGAMGTNSQYDPATGLISIYLVQLGKMSDETKKIQGVFHRTVADVYGKQPAGQPQGEKIRVGAN